MHNIPTFEDNQNRWDQMMENDLRYASKSQNLKFKSQSLPYSYRPTTITQYMEEKKNAINQQTHNPWNNKHTLKEKNIEEKVPKSYKHIISNLFNRKKKDLSDDGSSLSDRDSVNSYEINNKSDNNHKLKERTPFQNYNYHNVPNSSTRNHFYNDIQYKNQNIYYPIQQLTKVFSNEELSTGRLTNNQCYSATNLLHASPKRLIPSVSYDSLPASGISNNSESAYGSINSNISQTIYKGGRSSSMDTLTRRERREAIMAKVKKIRDKQTDSSSDDHASHSSFPGSDKSYRSNISKRNSKSSRTERYLRRKAQECDNLRRESEKDKRSKAIVEARILEIQTNKAEEQQQNYNKMNNTEKPRWSANLVYQESNEFDMATVPISLPRNNDVVTKRASSYDGISNIEKYNLYNQKLNSLNNNKSRISTNELLLDKSKFTVEIMRKGEIPPDPPPRDASKFLTPRELHRPFSYSFENIYHKERIRYPLNHSQHNFSSSPIRSNYINTNNLINGSKRAISEQKLYKSNSPTSGKTINVIPQNASCYNYLHPPKPQRASVTIIPEKNKNVISNSKLKSTSHTNVSERFKDDSNNIQITNLPPSPSSDYASYISENSSLITNPSSPRVLSREEFKELVTERALENPLPKSIINLGRSNIVTQEKPEPPKRDLSSINKGNKDFPKLDIKQNLPNILFSDDQEKQLKEAYNLEKERIIKSKCTNLEQAINELEVIYKKLDLNNDDILDGAERRDLPTEHQLMWGKCSSNSTNFDKPISPVSDRQKTPKIKRSHTPDKITDDVHYRRCVQANHKTMNKNNTACPSYMLFSPVHSPALDSDETNRKSIKEPNITSDDVTYRNIQRANAIKIIDPQPAFGIPLGPLTQGSSTDYLHLQPKENYKPIFSCRKYPDVVMDDMAFRNLRKDNSLSEKSLNLSELDNILSETDIISKSKRNVRSISLDRNRGSNITGGGNYKLSSNVPRHLKHIKRKSTKSKFYDGYRGAVTDSESILSHRKLNNYQKISSYDGIDSRTETITGQYDKRTSNFPITSAIINESKFPAGAPKKIVDYQDNPFKSIYSTKRSTSLEESPNYNTSEILPVGVDVIKLNDLISTIRTSENTTENETNYKTVHRNSKLEDQKSCLRPEYVSIADAEKSEGKEINRRYSSVDINSVDYISRYPNGMAYVAVENSNIVGPIKPELVFIPNSSSLEFNNANNTETNLSIEEKFETFTDEIPKSKKIQFRMRNSSGFSTFSNLVSQKHFTESNKQMHKNSNFNSESGINLNDSSINKTPNNTNLNERINDENNLDVKNYQSQQKQMPYNEFKVDKPYHDPGTGGNDTVFSKRICQGLACDSYRK